MVGIRSVTLLAIGWSAVASGMVAAQQVAGGSARGAIGPWHAVEAHGGDPLTADPASAIETARHQLAVGRAEQAIEILSTSGVSEDAEVWALRADAWMALGDFVAAAERFERAADEARGRERGVLLAKAALAREKAGESDSASALYLRAAEVVGPVRGWLELRAATLTADAGRGLELLASAPAAARSEAGALEGRLRLAVGDTVGAVAVLNRIEENALAARLSLDAGYPDLARELAYAALRDRASDGARDAADLVLERFPPATPWEAELLSRALARHGRAGDGLAVMHGWIAAGDSSGSTFGVLGELLEASGQRWAALEAFERAAAGSDGQAGEAEYRRIRLLVRLGRPARAVAALREYALRFPEHRRQAWATYLLGDLLWDAASRPTSDSAFHALVRQYPDDSYASLARYRLAARALAARDTALAIERFRDASASGGDQARSAHYQLGVLLERAGDREAARDVWMELARQDSLGYYGLIAREAAALPPPSFAPVEPTPQAARVVAYMEELDLLDRLGLADEAESLVAYLVSSSTFTPDERLDIAEALIARTRTVRGIRLGWELTRDFTLNHPRIVRIVFPYTNRELVEAEARKFELDPYLVAGMIRQESAFDPGAISRAGARGLMQLMPATARSQASRQGIAWTNRLLTVADANVHVGTAHLAALMRQYDGHLARVLAAYNAGGTPVRRWLRYPEANDPVRWIERIPYAETRGYVKTVLRNRELYRALYGTPPAS